MWPGPGGGSAGRSSGRATTNARPPVPSPLSSADALSRTRSPGRRRRRPWRCRRGRARGRPRPSSSAHGVLHRPRPAAHLLDDGPGSPLHHGRQRIRRVASRRVSSEPGTARPVGGAGEDRATAQPRARAALHPPAACRRRRSASSCRSTASRRRPRPSSGCSSATRTSCASSASRSSPRTSTRCTRTSPATASTSASTPCPTSHFEPDELAVLGLASRTWAQASLAGPAAQALRKLRAAGVERDVDALIGIEPRLRTTEPAFDAVKDGVLRRVPAALLLPAPRGGRGARAARAAVVARRRGTAAGTSTRFDVDRGAAAGVPPLAHRRGRAHRRAARVVRGARRPRAGAHGRAGRGSRRPSRARRCCACAAAPATACADGRARSARSTSTWDLVDLDYTDLEDFAEELAGYGTDVVVEAPPELVDSVVRRLRGVARGARGRALMAGLHPGDRHRAAVPAAHDGAVAGQPPGHRPAAGRRRPRRQRRAARGRPQPAVPLRLRPDARRADRGRLGGGPGLRRQRRHHRPPAAPRRRRGGDPGRRAARAARGARAWATATPSTVPSPSSRMPPARPPRRPAGCGPRSPTGGSPELLARARQAIADHRRVHLRYLVPGRDETTERDVDPMRVVGMDGRWYLEGWCHRAEDTRMFRIDRVEELTVLDVDGTPPREARTSATCPRAPSARLRDDLVVTLRLLPGATWVADYYPVESAEDVPVADGGGLLVRMRTADTAWLRRLVWRLGGRGDGARPARGGRRGPRRRRRGAHGLPGDAPTRAEPCCRGGAGCCSGSCCCSASAACLGVAGLAVWGKHQGPRARGAAGERARGRARGAGRRAAGRRPGPHGGHPAAAQDARAVSGATGRGEGRPARTPCRPAATVGTRTLTPDLARHVTDVTRHHRRWTPWAGSDPPRSSSSRC